MLLNSADVFRAWPVRKFNNQIQFFSMNLLDPIVPSEKFHVHFKNLLNKRRYCHDTVNDWASDYAPKSPKHRKKFITEFQTTYNSTIWELYLFALFKAYNFDFDWDIKRPDFGIKSGGTEVLVEAVISNNSNTSQPESTQIGDLSDLPDLENIEAWEVERFFGSIRDKHELYKNSYVKLPYVKGKPFVIALAPYMQPYSFLNSGLSLKALLYGRREIASTTLEIQLLKTILSDLEEKNTDLETLNKHPILKWVKTGEGPYAVLAKEEFKSNGSPLTLGLFSNAGMADVSAVLYNNTASQGKLDALTNHPLLYQQCFVYRKTNSGYQHIFNLEDKDFYQETIYDGLQIFHNPFAKNPLPRSFFRMPGVIQHYIDNGEYKFELQGDLLLWRNSVPKMLGQFYLNELVQYSSKQFITRLEKFLPKVMG